VDPVAISAAPLAITSNTSSLSALVTFA